MMVEHYKKELRLAVDRTYHDNSANPEYDKETQIHKSKHLMREIFAE